MPSTKSNPIDPQERNLASICLELSDIMVRFDKIVPTDDSMPMYEDVRADILKLRLDLQDYTIKHW